MMVKSQRPALWTVIVLVLLGATFVAIRLRARQEGRLSPGETLWQLTYDISFSAPQRGAGIRAALPSDTSHGHVFREQFSYPGSSMHVARNLLTRGKEAVVVALSPLNQTKFAAQFDVHVSPEAHRYSYPEKQRLTATERSHYLRSEKEIQTGSSAVSEVISGLAAGSVPKSGLLERVFAYCSERISPSGEDGPIDATSTLRLHKGTTLGRARAMVALCRAGRLPARLVTGFVLNGEQPTIPHTWVEVYSSEQWLPYDPETGYCGELPPSYLPVRRDGAPIVTAIEDVTVRSSFSARRLGSSSSGLRSPTQRHFSDILDLTRLSFGMQRTLALLLLVPVGALVTAIFRNLIGVQTFGTFTPILLALSFAHADWQTGTMVLVVVVAIGLAGRAFLNWLKLLTVPRLSVVLTLVVLSLTMAISALDYLRLTPAAQAVLLPMVILTMTIERFHVSAEEDGFGYAIKVLGGTLAVGFCSFLVLRLEGLGKLLLEFPEAHLFIVAALILIGRYTGYRLTELRRFRDISQPAAEDVT